jgi:glutathione synthase/RimK-type ligase-like ATP-grasp enzyme
MTALIYRRRKLGRTSAREISRYSKTGILNVRNDQRFPRGIDLVFRWGCTSNLPEGIPVINTAAAIHQVADKAAFRKLTADAGLAPKTWLSLDAWEEDYCEGVEAARKIVVRRATHHQGRFLHTFTYDDNGYRPDGVIDICAKYGEGNYYISEYIPKVAEYRVFMAQGRVVWVASKTPGNPDAVAWNVARGGRFDNVRWDQWPLKAIRVARDAFLLSSLDFGGVDIMVDAQDNAYVLEINSAPSQTSPYRQEAAAKAFDYIVNYGKDRIDVTEEKGGWRKFIHPAISNEAIMV